MNLFQSILAGQSLVANSESFLALFIGVVVGTVAKAIPGMSATTAVALTLPFTFAVPPVAVILLLIGVYKGGIFGSSIPAILIKTAGIPASSATILDGYPLAERGEAGRTLRMALWAFCSADMISNLSLTLFAGWLASFALILFSLTIIAGVSGESLLRGALAVMLGLLLATIGPDLIYGTNRFTFGRANLMGGLNFIAVLIGLLVSSAFLLVVGSIAIKVLRYVADIPRGILFPAVMVLCIFGVFAVNNNLFAVGVMFEMGWVGYVMNRLKIPTAPLFMPLSLDRCWRIISVSPC